MPALRYAVTSSVHDNRFRAEQVDLHVANAQAGAGRLTPDSAWRRSVTSR